MISLQGRERQALHPGTYMESWEVVIGDMPCTAYRQG